MGKYENIGGMGKYENIGGMGKYENIGGVGKYENIGGVGKYENIGGVGRHENGVGGMGMGVGRVAGIGRQDEGTDAYGINRGEFVYREMYARQNTETTIVPKSHEGHDTHIYSHINVDDAWGAEIINIVDP
eukprot:GHVR01109617.1.p1 GENE.GHVR01109617.1~~GHVR01109617.1.p1  ORF type:complete len:131 (+),score=42.65 GHVR01109617.1:332-724(+)